MWLFIYLKESIILIIINFFILYFALEKKHINNNLIIKIKELLLKYIIKNL